MSSVWGSSVASAVLLPTLLALVLSTGVAALILGRRPGPRRTPYARGAASATAAFVALVTLAAVAGTDPELGGSSTLPTPTTPGPQPAAPADRVVPALAPEAPAAGNPVAQAPATRRLTPPRSVPVVRVPVRTAPVPAAAPAPAAAPRPAPATAPQSDSAPAAPASAGPEAADPEAAVPEAAVPEAAGPEAGPPETKPLSGGGDQAPLFAPRADASAAPDSEPTSRGQGNGHVKHGHGLDSHQPGSHRPDDVRGSGEAAAPGREDADYSGASVEPTRRTRAPADTPHLEKKPAAASTAKV